MDLKLLNLAVGKLSDDLEKMKEQMKEMVVQMTIIKSKTSQEQKHLIPIQHTEKEFMTMREVMKKLKMSRNSILKLIKDGIVREIRFTKRTIRYDKDEIIGLPNRIPNLLG